MAEINNPQEPATFPSKRKPDDPIPQEPLIKAPKLSALDNNNNNSNNHVTASEPLAENEKSETDVVLDKEAGNSDTELRNDVVDNDKEHAGEEEEDDDDDDDDDEDDDEDDNVEAEVDRKGKGVLRDDKGKGKLIVEEDDEDDDDDDDDDSDDDSDVDGVSGDESDFSDDPLAEVDLNNILPSRTRRRTFQSGLHIPSKPVNFAAASADDDDDDDSDA